MTTEETYDDMRDYSEIKVERIRVIRSICRRGSGTTYSQTHVFLERLPINQTPAEITEKYLFEKIGAISPTGVLKFSENPDLNKTANFIFSHLIGRMDNARALNEIRNMIMLSGTLEPTTCPHG